MIHYGTPPCLGPSIAQLILLLLEKGELGSDQKPCWFMKEISNEFSPIFTYLFMQFVTTEKLPSFWNTTRVTPVLKKVPETYMKIIDPFHWLALSASWWST